MLQICLVGDEVLRKKAKPVKSVNAAVQNLIDEMTQAMYRESGVGLAAPQVGISKRIIVVDVGDGLVSLVNPELVSASGNQLGLEACLSIPDVVGEVERYATVRVTGLGRNGHRVWIDAEDLLARCLQHEMDHLDGILFTDRAVRILSDEEIAQRHEVVLD